MKDSLNIGALELSLDEMTEYMGLVQLRRQEGILDDDIVDELMELSKKHGHSLTAMQAEEVLEEIDAIKPL
ncbi:MAG: hypothetical protein ACOC32_04115 [Nanoarchaeota archaeon]